MRILIFVCDVKSLMSLKVWSILGPPKKKSKSSKVGRFLVNLRKILRKMTDTHMEIYF